MASPELTPDPTQQAAEQLHLHAVPPYEELGNSAKYTNDMAEINESLQTYVPKSVEEGVQVMDRMRQQATRIVERADGRHEVDGHEVGSSVATKFKANAEQGIDLWRLNTDGQRTARRILDTKQYDKLSPELQADVRMLKGEGDTDATAFQKYKQQTKGRLDLDAKIRAYHKGQPANRAEAPQASVADAPPTEAKPANVVKVSRTDGAAAKQVSTMTKHEVINVEPAEVKDVSLISTDAAAVEKPAEAKEVAVISDETVPEDGYDISDLVKVGKNGHTAHRSNGKFMSQYELDVVRENQGKIREGVETRERTQEQREKAKELLIELYGEEEYAKKFADNPDIDPETWKSHEYGTGKDEYKGKHRAEDHVSDAPEDIDEDLWNDFTDEERTVWASLSGEEKQNLRDFKVAEKSAKEQKDTTEPVTDTSEKGLKARWGKIKNKASVQLLMLKQDVKDRFDKVKGFYTDEEKGKRHKIITGVVAATAVIGAGVAIAYLETRGHSTHHATGGDGPQPPKPPKPPKPPVHHPHVAPKNYQEVTLKPGTGDSLWHEEALHHPHASQREILERVQRDMALNHIHNEQEAEHISGAIKITR